MFSLRSLLKRPGAVGIFIILQTICFLLIIYSNDRQGSLFFGLTNSMVGNIQEKRTNFTDRLAYKKRYDSLLVAHIALLNQQPTSLYSNQEELDSLMNDSLLIPEYYFRSAKVINNSFALNNNYLTLNKGSKQGVKAHMGVITNEGIVGIVVAVNNHFARVISILHGRSRITAEIKNKNLDGALTWDTKSPRYMYLEGVPSHYPIEIGDTVQTSSLSRIFPAGVPIGTIIEHNIPSGSSTHFIKVELSNDMRRLKEVYIVELLHKDEIEELEEQFPNE